MTPNEKQEVANNIIAQHRTCVQLDWSDEQLLISHIHDLRGQLDAARKQAKDRLEALKKTPSGFSFTEWAAYCGDLSSGYAGEKSAEVKEVQEWFRAAEAKHLVDEGDKEGGR